MDELQKKHKQEAKDLQARIIQKKRTATKKTRKGVNDECAELERHLKAQQDFEIAEIHGTAGESDHALEVDEPSEDVQVERAVPDSTAQEKQIESSVVSTIQLRDEYTKKPNRQKARLARRAAEMADATAQASKEAQDLPDLRQQECDAMRAHYNSRGLKEHEIRSDGHCLYAAIADQLVVRNQTLDPKEPISDLHQTKESSVAPYQTTRVVTAAYISDHSADFLPFLEEPLDDYVRKIRETGEWGGHLELLALAKAYDVSINVLQSSGQVEKIEAGAGETRPALWLSYYHHSFGLGEHYNSLRPGR
ncbi:MAG: hypothetical protein Q9220_002126 [cf. Caloplaca sp. 1 TL-2023]